MNKNKKDLIENILAWIIFIIVLLIVKSIFGELHAGHKQKMCPCPEKLIIEDMNKR